MNVLLWILQVLLAALFGLAGITKLIRSKEQLADQMAWVDDFSRPVVRFIGTAEVLAALGLLVPALTGIAVFLTPLAATGLIFLMLGAVGTHLRRKEFANVATSVVLLALAATVAWGRFGAYAF